MAADAHAVAEYAVRPGDRVAGGGNRLAAGPAALQQRGANAAIVQRAAGLNARGQARALRPVSSPGSAAPIQRAKSSVGKWLKWGGAGLAGVGLGALAMGLAPIGTVLALGGAAAAGAGYLMDRDEKGEQVKKGKQVKRPRSGLPIEPDWYDKRAKTAYGDTTGLGYQGPHTIPHIGKRVAAQHASEALTGFDPVAISERTGLLPSPGQGRRLLREYEENTGTTIPRSNKKSWNQRYKGALARRDLGTREQQVRATVEAMELNPLATYSLDKKASHDEIKGKGERRHTVAPDLELMSAMDRDSPMPSFAKVDLPSKPAHKLTHMHKLFRDTGKVNLGEDDLSEFELSSDDEYSSDED